MNKKTIAQVMLIILIIVISSLIYFKYFNKNQKNLMIKKEDTSKNSSSNYIENINHTSLDSKGNKYQINSLQAEIDVNNQDIMFLEDVTAYIFLKDSDTVKITSDFGKYNSKNYDTIFSKNVIVIYSGHKITGEYLDFSFLNNLGTVSTNVIYVGNEKILFADRLEMNIETKDTKIFMNDTKKKVSIEGTK